MAIQLHEAGVAHAKKLIQEKQINTARDNWHECKPTPEKENDYLNNHSMEEYGLWFLGINTDHPANTKEHYEFPYGDFENVYYSGLIAAEKRAGQYHHTAIEKAAKELYEMID